MTIREATPADAAELARLRWDFHGSDERNHLRLDFLKDCAAWLREALASGRWTIVVAESQPALLIGCMYLQSVEKVPAPGAIRRKWGYVTNCYVAVEHRGQGIGTELLQFLINGARGRGLEFLIVWPSETSVSFYSRAGFISMSKAYTGSDNEQPLELML
jgi:predicted N-acetyltransferase YhbS